MMMTLNRLIAVGLFLMATQAVPASEIPPATAPTTVALPGADNAPVSIPAEAPRAASPVQEGCRPLSFKAMAADVKAFNAQTQKLELTEQAQLFKEALSLWSHAVEQCEGRAKEQALRNLAESQKVLSSIGEQLGSGPQCASAHKDALSLQEMAKHALGERHWSEAAMLFHKSENLWELASDDCIGSQQEIARRRRDEAEIDGHNAEFCAPLFEKAREQTQKMRASAAILSREDKQEASMIAETLWRDAVAQCRGATAQDSARNNAQALAKERGTPWVARGVIQPAPSVNAVTPVTSVAQKNVANIPAGGMSAAPASLPTARVLPELVHEEAGKPASIVPVNQLAATGGAGRLAGGAVATVATVAAATVVPTVVSPSSDASKVTPVEFKAENAGKLNSYSGNGKVVWVSGDVYEGGLEKGQRHGKGRFTWANGQRYEGDWVHDKSEGQGSLRFANANQYDGEIHEGIPQGQGRMLYASGDSYTGNFNAGEPEGRGIYVWKNGQRFDGEWKNGSSNGQGSTLFVSGDHYAGNYSNGLSEGVGEYDWVNGDKYVGQWKSGKMHGQGKFVWKNGNQWEGIYENGKQTEQGKTTLNN